MAGLIGFVHIPKSGGTSLRHAFTAAGSVVWRPHGDRYLLDLGDPDLDGVDVVAGHIPVPVLRRLPVVEWVTVLRDPVQRWLSHYIAECDACGRCPPLDVVPDNLMTRLLSDDLTPDEDAATTNLARFDHVGFTDHLDATFARYGLTSTHQRPSPDRPPPPARLLEAAREANQIDLRVYANARRALA